MRWLQRTRNSQTCHPLTISVLNAVIIPGKIQLLLSQGYSQSLFEDFLLTSTGIGWTDDLSRYWQGPKPVMLCTCSLGLSRPWSPLAITRMNLLTIGVILSKAEKKHSNKNARNIKNLNVVNQEFKQDSSCP